MMIIRVRVAASHSYLYVGATKGCNFPDAGESVGLRGISLAFGGCSEIKREQEAGNVQEGRL